jgi:hypothetical protein
VHDTCVMCVPLSWGVGARPHTFSVLGRGPVHRIASASLSFRGRAGNRTVHAGVVRLRAVVGRPVLAFSTRAGAAGSRGWMRRPLTLLSSNPNRRNGPPARGASAPPTRKPEAPTGTAQPARSAASAERRHRGAGPWRATSNPNPRNGPPARGASAPPGRKPEAPTGTAQSTRIAATRPNGRGALPALQTPETDARPEASQSRRTGNRKCRPPPRSPRGSPPPGRRPVARHTSNPPPETDLRPAARQRRRVENRKRRPVPCSRRGREVPRIGDACLETTSTHCHGLPSAARTVDLVDREGKRSAQRRRRGGVRDGSPKGRDRIAGSMRSTTARPERRRPTPGVCATSRTRRTHVIRMQTGPRLLDQPLSKSTRRDKK